MPELARALTIAGSDSGGGAGIQADLKTFEALGAYGMSAITAITAQNTVAVTGIHELPPELVGKQIDAVASDIGVDAAKTGMLSSADIVEAVGDAIQRNGIEMLVVDPVMIAKSGDALLQASARNALIEHIVPRAFVITPNIPEAEVLSGVKIDGVDQIEEVARRIHDLGARNVLVKGGHLDTDDVVDVLFDGATCRTFTGPRIASRNTHGTGCTLSAAITAHLARGISVPDAVSAAKEYVTEAIRRSLDIGRGHGPLLHAWPHRD